MQGELKKSCPPFHYLVHPVRLAHLVQLVNLVHPCFPPCQLCPSYPFNPCCRGKNKKKICCGAYKFKIFLLQVIFFYFPEPEEPWRPKVHPGSSDQDKHTQPNTEEEDNHQTVKTEAHPDQEPRVLAGDGTRSLEYLVDLQGAVSRSRRSCLTQRMENNFTLFNLWKQGDVERSLLELVIL